MIHDLTLPLSASTLVFPGDPPPQLRRVSDLGAGDLLTATHLSLGCHVGTHVDAPAHFLADGRTLEELPLECFYGPAVVVELLGQPLIAASDLERAGIPEGHHVLLKTDNSALLRLPEFTPGYCFLTESAAEFLCSRNPWSVGFDYYSLDPVGTERFRAHNALARCSVPAFVCLDLSSVPAGRYTFAGLPLRLSEAEGAPVRALLIGA